MGAGDLPDLGGSHFVRLEPPRVGLFSRPGFNASDFGTLWHTLDHRLALRHSILDETSRDLPRYNVLVLPDGAAKPLSDDSMKELKSWVEAGGTLIAIGDSAAQLATEKSDLSKVRTLPTVLDKLPEYELAVFREWMAAHGPVPAAPDLWSHDVRPGLEYPWQAIKGEGPDEKELKRRDAWAKPFMPQGAIVAGRIDPKHWLTAGVDELVPIMIARDPVLMAAEGIQTAVRFGVLVPNTTTTTNKTEKAGDSSKSNSKSKSRRAVEADDGDDGHEPRRDTKEEEENGGSKKEPSRPGWSAIPEGFELRLRMSGLLWPEAAHRLANAAYLTRESRGRGQVILFASAPTFRNSMLGTTRLFLNAVVYGPGFGADPVIRP